ncbi:hypothetical protein ACFL43_05195 [Thermodesulfobacteriota bacterium]
MHQILIIHPVGQALALLLGVVNLVTGYFGKGFNRALHLNCGMLFYFLTIIGAGVGFAVARWAAANEYVLQLGMHGWNALLVLACCTAGAVTGFLILGGGPSAALIKKYHRGINLFGVVLGGVQAASGVFALLSL